MAKTAGLIPNMQQQSKHKNNIATWQLFQCQTFDHNNQMSYEYFCIFSGEKLRKIILNLIINHIFFRVSQN
jgi:hypothetical protein